VQNLKNGLIKLAKGAPMELIRKLTSIREFWEKGIHA